MRKASDVDRETLRLDVRQSFVLRWVFVSVVSIMAVPVVGVTYLLALGIVFQIMVVSSTTLFWNVVFTIISFLGTVLVIAVAGILIGVLQWSVVFDGLVSQRHWVAATVVIGFMGVPSSLIGLKLSDPIFASCVSKASGMAIDCTLADTWFRSVTVMGAAVGLAVALPQWFVLRKSAYQAGWWIPVNITGVVVALSLYVLAVYALGGLCGAPLGICASPLAFSLITGFVLYRLLQRSEKEPGKKDHITEGGS